MQFREEPWPPTDLSEWAAPSQVNDLSRQQMALMKQLYANASRAQNNYLALVDPARWMRVEWSYPREAVAADLGIIDQNLDDKIGMEP